MVTGLSRGYVPFLPSSLQPPLIYLHFTPKMGNRPEYWDLCSSTAACSRMACVLLSDGGAVHSMWYIWSVGHSPMCCCWSVSHEQLSCCMDVLMSPLRPTCSVITQLSARADIISKLFFFVSCFFLLLFYQEDSTLLH